MSSTKDPKQFEPVMFKDGASGYCSCGEADHHITPQATKPVAPEKWQDTPNVPVEIEGYRTKPVDELDRLAEYNKLAHPGLGGMCYLCGVNPYDIKALLTEARISELNEIDIHYWGDDDTDVYMNEVLEPYLAERRAQLKNKGAISELPR